MSNTQTQAGLAQCWVVPANPGAKVRALHVAEQLDLPWAMSPPDDGIALVVDIDDAWLQQLGGSAPGPVSVDFAAPAMLHRRRGGQNELLGRAVGVRAERKPVVFDATAGLGRDAFVLADLGCRVTLSERSAVLAWLLQQAVELAAINALESVRAAASRMQVLAGDSLQHTVEEGAVVYLDPMFPERRNSAAVKKDLALLQHLHADGPEHENRMMDWAWQQPVSRIVVKRPAKAPPIAGRRPSHALSGKAVRFDVYSRSSGVTV